MHKLEKIAILLVTTALLSSCSLADKFLLPKVEIPAAYKEEAKRIHRDWRVATLSENADRGQWWLIYGDQKLNELQDRAREQNQNLKAAAARVEQARAIARASNPDFFPNLDLGFNAARQRQTAGANPAVVSARPYSLYNARAQLSYEPDLFARARSEFSALKQETAASEALYKSVLLALQADVAENYFNIRAVDAEIETLKLVVAANQEATRIARKKYKEGEVDEIELRRAESALSNIKTDMFATERRRLSLEHALAVLLGEMPSGFSFAYAPLAGIPPAVPAGIPSKLLERRPDMTVAIARMAAANERIGGARAAFFPSISLTASGGYESAIFGNLFQWSARNWMLGQMGGFALTLPILDNSRRNARLDLAKASYEEAIASYRQSVLVAFKEVEDALSDQRILYDQAVVADKTVNAADRVVALAQKKFVMGDIDYADVVTARDAQLRARRQGITTHNQRYLTSITLIRALGGSWDYSAAVVVAPSQKTN